MSLPVLLVALVPATVLMDWGPDEVVRHADRIVVGEVITQETLLVGEHLMTESRVRVDETLLGESLPELVLTQYGGQRGTKRTELVGDARLSVGQRVLLVTRQQGGRTYLVGMTLGAYRVVGPRLFQRVDVSLQGVGGEVVPAPGERVLTLDAFRAVVRARR